MFKKLAKYIGEEQDRFEVQHNNMFSLAFGEILRYGQFLDEIERRHQIVTNEYRKMFHEFQNTIDKTPGSHPFTDKQMKINSEMTRLMLLVQLEIESFYLYAKILLDKVARDIELYFGQARGLSLDSHDDFAAKIERYAKSKDIKLNEGLINSAKKLKEDISDFRDYQIAHLKNPRTVRGTSIDGRMSLMQIYPKDTDTQKQTKLILDLLEDLSNYIDLIVEFLVLNKDKTYLKVK